MEYNENSLGVDANGKWCRSLPDGSMVPIDPADADAPGHLTKRGIHYANYAFPLSQASSFRVLEHVGGGRIYISLGAPLCIPIGANAWGGPDLLNPNDPNADVIFDWYEYTYVFGGVPFGGNTTQVDQFGFPMTARLRQDASHYDETVGITLSREEVFAKYASGVGPAFRPLASAYRIVAPRSSALFKPSGLQATYLQGYLGRTWSYYASHHFSLTRLNATFAGSVVDNRLQFTRTPAGGDGSGPFFLDLPTTTDVFECSGSLARGGMKTSELELGAEVCAAFNRGVAESTASWHSPAAYYADTLDNEYAKFFHSISLSNRSYGFAYDDVNDQSSVKILPNSDPPTSLTLTIEPVRAGTSLARPAHARAKRSMASGFFRADGKAADGPATEAVFLRPRPRRDCEREKREGKKNGRAAAAAPPAGKPGSVET